MKKGNAYIPHSKLETYYRCHDLPIWFRIQLWIDSNTDGWNTNEFIVGKKWKSVAKELDMPRESFLRGMSDIEKMGNYTIDRKKRTIKKVTGESPFSLDKIVHRERKKVTGESPKKVTPLLLKKDQADHLKSDLPVTPHPNIDLNYSINSFNKEKIKEEDVKRKLEPIDDLVLKVRLLFRNYFCHKWKDETIKDCIECFIDEGEDYILKMSKAFCVQGTRYPQKDNLSAGKYISMLRDNPFVKEKKAYYVGLVLDFDMEEKESSEKHKSTQERINFLYNQAKSVYEKAQEEMNKLDQPITQKVIDLLLKKKELGIKASHRMLQTESGENIFKKDLDYIAKLYLGVQNNGVEEKEVEKAIRYFGICQANFQEVLDSIEEVCGATQ